MNPTSKLGHSTMFVVALACPIWLQFITETQFQYSLSGLESLQSNLHNRRRKEIVLEVFRKGRRFEF